jgi:hypothetical protein
MRAERRVGELIQAQKETSGLNGGGRPKKTGLNENPVSLAEAGIDKNLAHRARKLAGMTDEQFERAIDDAREDIERPSSRRAGDDEEPGIEDDVDPKNYRTAFLLRVDAALSIADYSGPIAKDLIAKGSAGCRRLVEVGSTDGEESMTKRRAAQRHASACLP